MAFAPILDILGSIVVGGTILLILLKMNDSTVENHYLNSGELIVQNNLISIVELLEHDLRKIGYCEDWQNLPDPTVSILAATSNSISFLTDVAVSETQQTGDGTVDTIRYWIGDPNDQDVIGTPNPRDRMLFRQVNNGQPHSANLGLTQFDLRYYDADGDEITSMPSSPPLGIITLQIDITVENTAAYGDESIQDVYSKDKSAFWRQIRLAAPSLGNR
jgi:hypothetical protein